MLKNNFKGCESSTSPKCTFHIECYTNSELVRHAQWRSYNQRQNALDKIQIGLRC